MGLRQLYQLHKVLRQTLESEDFLEVSVPPLVEHPGIEAHIHPMQVRSVYQNQHLGFLHTSPEFALKKLLSLDSESFSKIFCLTYSFRDEPESPIHRNQFQLLEWYRTSGTYLDLISDVEKIVKNCANALDLKAPSSDTATVDELFKEYLSFSILDFPSIDELQKKIELDFPETQLDKEYSYTWDDLFFLLFLNKIEPKFIQNDFFILKDYPVQLGALAKRSDKNPQVVERCEIYLRGIEIANGWTELTDLEEHKKRIHEQAIFKKDIYQYELPYPSQFMQTIEQGLPESCGMAMGVERLYSGLTDQPVPFFNMK